ncbi:hypothetical protein ABF87_12935 [Nitrosomonas sp. JL21]|uniref:hypothetical protein n=1 Tax=Nitrosomonas sp. JL21 TaxID=153949 RepID=UPI0013710D47|nr:hypothetical protein [Nitrosomonas sp. JL21]MBL8497088.1 hypothetical protein [Nitrosomonas sp.]MCC7090675.1 hypothetical protein [Nitrosomonas sp.]MXS78841.1 hypothetical protein [Nitrosomonas sp. JL21]
MHKFLANALLFLVFSLSHTAFSHEGEDHDHDHSDSQLESGHGWRVVRAIEMGTSGKLVHMILVDHDVHTDKTVYSAAINRLCRTDDEFCRIRFWSQERYIPEKVSLTTEQNKQLKAEYVVNKTAGIHQLRWSCSVNPVKGQCF